VAKNVTVTDGVEAITQSILATPRRQRRLLSKTFWGKLGIRRRTKKRVEEVTGALRQRGLTLKLDDAEFGTESKNAWLVLSYAEPSPKPVATQALHREHSDVHGQTPTSSQAGMLYVQSAITHISCPQNFQNEWDTICKLEDWIADLDNLHYSALRASRQVYWTAPRWVMQEDIVFLYMTKSSKTNVDRLVKESNQNRSARLRSKEQQSTSLEWPERICLGILDDLCNLR